MEKIRLVAVVTAIVLAVVFMLQNIPNISEVGFLYMQGKVRLAYLICICVTVGFLIGSLLCLAVRRKGRENAGNPSEF